MTALSQNSTLLQNWTIFEIVPNAQKIATELKKIPRHWALTPIQDKQPKRKGWQTETPLTFDEIAQLILHGELVESKQGNKYRRYWSGFGLRTGNVSGGLLAIDVDGPTAETLLKVIANGDIPQTVSWTSQKSGRYQLLFQIPIEYQDALAQFNRAVITQWGEIKSLHDKEGKPIELLEFRYNGCQSCLPPSRHPTTGNYSWINPPDTTEVAITPEWLCKLLVDLTTKEAQAKEERKKRVVDYAALKKEHKGGIITDLVDFLHFEVLPKLSVEQIYNDNHNFRQYGDVLKGSPTWRISASGTSFHVWWDGSQWAWTDKATGEGGGAVQYKWKLRGGSGTPKGQDWIDIVRDLAETAGVSMPEFQKSPQISKSTKKALITTQVKHTQFISPRVFLERRATLEAPQLILGTDDYRTKVALLSRQNASPELAQVLKEHELIQSKLKEAKTSDEPNKLNCRLTELTQIINILLQQENYKQKVHHTQQRLSNLTITPDMNVLTSYSEFIDDELLDQIPSWGILILPLGTGSGKSTFVGKLLQKYNTRPAISLVPTIGLAQNQASDWKEYGLEFRNDIIDDYTSTHLGVTALRNAERVVLCYPSLHQLYGKKPDDLILIADEAEAGLEFLQTSNLCNRDGLRPKNLAAFRELLEDPEPRKVLTIISESQISDITLDYYRQFYPSGAPITIITSSHSRPRKDIFFYGRGEKSFSLTKEGELKTLRHGSYQKTHFELVFEQSLASNDNIIFFNDSQRELEAGDLVLPEVLAQIGLSNRKNLRIDSTTLGTPEVQQFLVDPNKAIALNQYDIVSYTTSVGAGISITLTKRMATAYQQIAAAESIGNTDLINHWKTELKVAKDNWLNDEPYFQVGFGINNHLDPRKILQGIDRPRHPIPYHLFCGGDIGLKGNKSPLPQDHITGLQHHQNDLARLYQQALMKESLENNLTLDSNIQSNMFDIMSGLFNNAVAGLNHDLNAWSQFRARECYSQLDRSDKLKSALLLAGYKIKDPIVPLDATNNLTEFRQLKRKELDFQKATRVIQQQVIAEEIAKQLLNKSRKQRLTLDEQDKLDRFYLEKTFPNYLDELETQTDKINFYYTLFILDKGNWLRAQTLYQSFLHKDLVNKSNLLKFIKTMDILTNYNCEATQDLLKNKAPLLELISEIHLFDFMAPGTERTSAEIKAYVDSLFETKDIARKIQTHLHRGNPKQPTKFIKQILACFGHTLSERKSDGQRYYKIHLLRLSGITENDAQKIGAILGEQIRANADNISLLSRARQKEKSITTVVDAALLNSCITKEPESNFGVSQPEVIGDTAVPEAITTPSTFLPLLPILQVFQQDSEWQPQDIAEVAQMLDACEDSQTLALLRRCQDIPKNIFQMASRLLAPAKRLQIRQWVILQNLGLT